MIRAESSVVVPDHAEGGFPPIPCPVRVAFQTFPLGRAIFPHSPVVLVESRNAPIRTLGGLGAVAGELESAARQGWDYLNDVGARHALEESSPYDLTLISAGETPPVVWRDLNSYNAGQLAIDCRGKEVLVVNPHSLEPRHMQLKYASQYMTSQIVVADVDVFEIPPSAYLAQAQKELASVGVPPSSSSEAMGDTMGVLGPVLFFGALLFMSFRATRKKPSSGKNIREILERLRQ